jgi:DNA-binding beta-propeller fold protein YncE
MKRILFALLTVLVTLSIGTAPRISEAASQSDAAHSSQWQIFSRPASMPSFLEPHGIAFDSRGNVYVADTRHNQIQKLSSSGVRLAVFGSYGLMPGHFRGPSGVAVDRWDDLFVVDAQNYRVQKLSASGQPLAVFGLPDGGLPNTIAVDWNGSIYLSYYNRTQKLSPSGIVLATWRHGGAVAADRHGNVYVTGNDYNYDYRSREYYHDIYKLSPEPELLTPWPNGLRYVASMAVGLHGNLYILESRNQSGWHVVEIAPTGEIVENWAPFARWLLESPSALAVDALGNVYIADSGNQHVFKLTHTGELVAAWGMHGTSPGRFRLPSSASVDQLGNLYVAETGNNRIQKFSPNGKLLRSWGSPGHGPGQFVNPSGVAVNRQGNVVVADYGNYRIETFSPTGKLLGTARVPGPRVGYYYYPGYYYAGSPSQAMSLALDRQGNYVISDSLSNRVEKVSPKGKLLTIYSEWATARDSAVAGVTVDRANNIYVVDSAAPRIMKLSPSGRRLAVWGRFGYVRAGEFNRPAGIAVDGSGNLFISDVGNNSIQELSTTGQPLASWGVMGSAPGQFAYPQSVAMGPNGILYVADTWNDRIQRLAP